MYYFKDHALKSFRKRLTRLYGDQADRCLGRLNVLLSRYDNPINVPDYGCKKWSERDIALITYGDMICRAGETPLATLREFAARNLKGAVNTIHVLPFCPYSSDDGFSVIDYRQVNPALGSWADIDALAGDFRLMADLVLNHVSSRSTWFKDYISGVMPYRNYFIEAPPHADLSAVVRPRKSSLLRRTDTRDGVRYLWTTFSDDQIDVDFGNPDVLFEFLDILLMYLEHGAGIIRLDAIAYLWKRIGTSCIHLPETHEAVKLIRQILDAAAPGAILITETNVPHQENVSYFGHGDEADMVYQFSLPPLLLQGLRKGTSEHLRSWAAGSMDAPRGCTFLNFTASHDGIGVRPLEGLVDADEIQDLCDIVRAKGGFVSSKTNADGAESPYELNITYYDVLQRDADSQEINIARYLCSQVVSLSLKGMPALYFNNLFGARNDTAQAEKSGLPRAVNRQKWEYDQLMPALQNAATREGAIFQELMRILKIRRELKAFHPDAAQEVPDLGNAVLGLLRISLKGDKKVLALHNLTASPAEVRIADCGDAEFYKNKSRLYDFLACEPRQVKKGHVRLEPYQCAWLTPAD